MERIWINTSLDTTHLTGDATERSFPVKLKLILIAALILLSCGFYSASKEVKSVIKAYDYSVSTSNPVAILNNAGG